MDTQADRIVCVDLLHEEPDGNLDSGHKCWLLALLELPHIIAADKYAERDYSRACLNVGAWLEGRRL